MSSKRDDVRTRVVGDLGCLHAAEVQGAAGDINGWGGASGCWLSCGQGSRVQREGLKQRRSWLRSCW
jgi:hypothetical protein